MTLQRVLAFLTLAGCVAAQAGMYQQCGGVGWYVSILTIVLERHSRCLQDRRDDLRVRRVLQQAERLYASRPRIFASRGCN